MANGEVTVKFSGLNLDECIDHELEFSGFAKCTHCDQVYTFQVQVGKKYQMPKYPETKVEPAYIVAINFSGNNILQTLEPEYTGQPRDTEPPCQPCNGCTPNCERKRGR